MIRALFRSLGLVFAVLLFAVWLPALFGVYGLFWERYAAGFLTNPMNPGYRWYRPLETVAGGSTQPLSVSRTAAAAFSPQALEQAAAYARFYNSDSLLVMYRGELAFEQYWNTRKPESLFSAHAFTKTLTAILVGHAIADGRILSVDQPAYHFLPEWDDEQHRGITIRDLLGMTSGLQESDDFSPWSQRMQRIMGTDIVGPNLAVRVSGPPGVTFADINPPAQILGIIIERATGRRFGDYLSGKLWRPIGARDAQLFVDHPGGTAHTDCCMWSVIQDWARVGEALRTGGLWNGERVIPAGWVEQMITPSGANSSYGMMVWLGNLHETNQQQEQATFVSGRHQSEPFAAPTFFLDGAQLQRVWIVPSKELVVVRTGSEHPDWDEARLPNLLIRGLTK